jgi:hypothetical protein
MKKWMQLPVAAMLGSLASAAFAGDFDGSKALICAPVQAIVCHAGETCETGMPDEVGAPSFLRIDFAKKAIVGVKRITPIRTMEQDDKQILLQGTEMGVGWNLALDVADGKMVGTMNNRDGAFVLFGSCTPL